MSESLSHRLSGIYRTRFKIAFLGGFRLNDRSGNSQREGFLSRVILTNRLLLSHCRCQLFLKIDRGKDSIVFSLTMPILWLHLWRRYVYVFTLAVAAFIAVVLTTRLDEIARFAAMGASRGYVARFILLQIPYILPIVIPIGCLISALVLLSHMSQTRELTALRSCGFSLSQVLFPLMVAGGVMALGNFYVVSEWTTQAHLSARRLQGELRSINPMALLQNTQFLKGRRLYANVLGFSHGGDWANHVILAAKDPKEHRLHVVLFQNLRSSPPDLVGEGATLFTTRNSSSESVFDLLYVESAQSLAIPLRDFGQIVGPEGWKLVVDHLKLPLLLARLDSLSKRMSEQEDGGNARELQLLRRRVNGCLSEISRRGSLACAAFVFTLLGAAFGVGISRRSSVRGIGTVLALAAFYLICFFLAKKYSDRLVVATALYALPLVLIVAISIRHLHRVSRGVE